MDNRTQKLVVICDNDADHSFTLEGELRNQNFEVIIISEANGLVQSVKSLQPVAVLANPAVSGFNETEVCKQVMTEMNIPVLLLLDKDSTQRATIGECNVNDVIVKPAKAANVANLINKQMALHKSNP